MPSKSYPCVACPIQIFPCKADLSRHYSALHKSGEIPCPQCKVKFSTMDTLRLHFKIHDPNRSRPFKCTVEGCGRGFYLAGDAKRHAATVHSTERPFPCPLQCGQSFKTKQNVDLHNLSHTKEKTYKCDHCNSSFAQRSNLKRHISHHTVQENSHKCIDCGKKFVTSHDLKGHIRRIHTRQTGTTYPCPQCPKKLLSKSSLTKHSVIHDPDRKLVDCYFCSKKLTNRGCMEKHLRIHTTEEPFFCQEEACNYSSGHATLLSKHVENVHTSATPRKYTCYFCLASFKENAVLINHMRIHTREEPFSCEMCKKSFKSVSRRSQHIRHHHTKEKAKKCNVCKKFFASGGDLKRHSATHTGEKRFFCDICSYASYQSGCLKRHEKTHT